MTEVEDYKKLIQKHPARALLRHISAPTQRGNITALILTAQARRRPHDVVQVVGIAIRRSDDPLDPLVGKLAAIHNGLNQLKGYVKRKA